MVIRRLSVSVTVRLRSMGDAVAHLPLLETATGHQTFPSAFDPRQQRAFAHLRARRWRSIPPPRRRTARSEHVPSSSLPAPATAGPFDALRPAPHRPGSPAGHGRERSLPLVAARVAGGLGRGCAKGPGLAVGEQHACRPSTITRRAGPRAAARYGPYRQSRPRRACPAEPKPRKPVSAAQGSFAPVGEQRRRRRPRPSPHPARRAGSALAAWRSMKPVSIAAGDEVRIGGGARQEAGIGLDRPDLDRAAGRGQLGGGRVRRVRRMDDQLGDHRDRRRA